MAEFRYSQTFFLRFTVTLFHSNLDEKITSNEQKATSKKQRAKSNEQRAKSNEQPSKSNEQPSKSNEQPAKSNEEKATSNEQKVTSIEQQAKIQPPSKYKKRKSGDTFFKKIKKLSLMISL